MSRCPKCQAENPEDSRFCVSCGVLMGAGVSAADETSRIRQPVQPGPTDLTEVITTANVAPTEMIDHEATPTRQIPQPSDQSSETGQKYDISKIFASSGVCPSCYASLSGSGQKCPECGHILESATTIVTPPSAAPPLVKPGHAESVAQPGPVTAVPAGSEPVSGPVPPPVPTSVSSTPPGTSGRSFLWIIMGAVAVLLVVGALALYFLWPTISRNMNWAENTSGENAGTENIQADTAADEPLGDPAMDHKQQAQDYERLKRWAEAEKEWIAYLAQKPEDSEALLRLAGVYYEQGQLGPAMDKLQLYLGRDPADPTAHGLAARINVRRNMDDGAIGNYLTAIAHDPENGVWHSELGEIYSRGGFSEKAITQFQTAWEKDPENEQMLWRLIEEVQKTGRTERVAELGREYLSRFPAGIHGEYVRELSEQPDSIAKASPETRGAPTQGKQAAAETEAPAREEKVTAGKDTVTPVSSKPVSREKDTQAYAPDVPPPPSQFSTLLLDGSALNYSGKYARITLSFAGISQTFTSQSRARIQNVPKGSHSYTVTVEVIDTVSGETTGTFTGSGVLEIRYPNQRLMIQKVGNQAVVR